MKEIIYAADDEANIRELIKDFLVKEGYIVEVFENGELLYERFLEKPADLVILDIMMPEMDGYTTCTQLRKISNVPIIFLTAKDTDVDYVTGMTLGSDDYFTKPFSPMVLVARVKAIFRRISMENEEEGSGNGMSTFADLKIDYNNRKIYCKNNDLALTRTEFRLLIYFIENANRSVGREELLNKIWGFETDVDTRVTDDTVKRIRKKLTAAGSHVMVETVWGYGFKLSKKDD